MKPRPHDSWAEVYDLAYEESFGPFYARLQDDIDWQEQDMALCVFTVVLYLIDEDSLAAAMQTARSALRDGGLLLIDVPCAGLFQGYSRTSDRMQREVTIGDGRGDLFDYEESIRVRLPGGEWTEYHDQFPIRCWRPEEVFDAATAAGMAHLEDVSSAFAGSGSSYHLFKA